MFKKLNLRPSKKKFNLSASDKVEFKMGTPNLKAGKGPDFRMGKKR